MVRPYYLEATFQAANATYFASDHITTSTAPFTLAATRTTDGLAHQIGLYSSQNLSALSFFISGLDQDNVRRSTTIAGPNNNTVETSQYFKQLNEVSLVTAGSTGQIVDVGIVDEIATQTYPLNPYNDRGVSLISRVTSTTSGINYTWQYTGDDVQTKGSTASSSLIQWINHDDANLVNATATKSGNFAFNPVACRLIVNSYSSTPTLNMTIIENGK